MSTSLFLSSVYPLDKFPFKEVIPVLSKLYHLKGRPSLLATVLNASFYEKKFTFIINLKIINELLKKDELSTIKNISLKVFKTFVQEGVDTHYWKVLSYQEEQYLLTLTHPALLHYIDQKVGMKAFSEQQFFSEKVEDLYERFQHEKKRYVALLDQSLLEEDVRLTTPPSQEEFPKVVLSSVETGIRLQKQRKIIADIELEMLKLKELILERETREKERKNIHSDPEIFFS